MARAGDTKWTGLLGAGLCLASPALAMAGNAASIAVETQSCADLDTSRIRALFALELGASADRLGAQSLKVTCAPTETRLEIVSTRMGAIERVLKTSLDREEPERIVALAAAQLVLAAWVEIPPERTVPEAQPAPAPPSPDSAFPPARSNPTSVLAELDVGVRARSLGRVELGPALGLSMMAWRGHWGALVGASADRLTATRALGGVELMVSELELAPAWRSSAERALSFEMSLGPALALVRLRGIEPAPSVRAGVVAAVTLDAKARAALRYHRGWLSLRAALDAGYLFSGAEGTISADSTILARGPWVGLTLGGGAVW